MVKKESRSAKARTIKLLRSISVTIVKRLRIYHGYASIAVASTLMASMLFLVFWSPRVHTHVPQALSAKHDTNAPSRRFTTDYHLPQVEDGIVPVISKIPTTQPVVFLTIDDGDYKDASVTRLLKKYNLPVSLFLSRIFIDNNPKFFSALATRGASINNHTVTHDINLYAADYETQRAEICDMNEYIKRTYNLSAHYFRPPGGAYSETTLRAAASCGIRALVTWEAKANGGAMQYQYGNSLRPGDIVLMHFRPEFEADLQAFLDAAKSAKLTPQLLDDWLNRF